MRPCTPLSKNLAAYEGSLTGLHESHRRVAGTFPPLILVFASSGKCESDEGIANRVITRVPATQAVTIRGDTSIRDISAERVDNKFASICEVGYGTSRRSTGVGNVGGGVEGNNQHASLFARTMKVLVS